MCHQFFFFFSKSAYAAPWGFPCGLAGKESTCNVGDLGSIPGLRRSPGEGKCYSLQYSGLKNSMDREPGGHSLQGYTESGITEQAHTSKPSKIFIY